MNFYIFLLIFTINFINPMRLNDYYCLKNFNKCNPVYSFECNNKKICSTTQHNCRLLNLWPSMISKASESFNDYQQSIIQYNKIIRDIEECEQVWNISDICLNQPICNRRIVIPYRLKSTKIEIIKSFECKCPKSYNYKCNNDVCALERTKCSGFRSNSSRSELISMGIKKCEN